MSQMHHIAERMFNTPLMLDMAKAQVIANSLAPRILGEGITVNTMVHVGESAPQMGVVGDKLGGAYERWGDSPLTICEGAALIEIEGTLAHKGRYIGKSSGVTTYEGIATQIRAAKSDPAVLGIVLEVDSFGGEVAGCFALAHEIHELAKEKPVMAILTDHACSAGYLLASAANTIAMPETGLAGSIGVVMMHADWSVALDKEGVSVTLLHDGAHKIDGNPYEPLPDGVRADLGALLAESRTLFCNTVGGFRGNRFTADDARKTEAQTFHGNEALRLGLVDAVATPDAAFDAFLNEIN